MAVKLFTRLPVDHLQACFQVLIYMQTINQITESVLKQNPQDSLIPVKMAVSPVDCTKLPDAKHQSLLARPFIQCNLEFFNLSAKIRNVICCCQIELLYPIFDLPGKPELELIFG
jgi:hypothetical protein